MASLAIPLPVLPLLTHYRVVFALGPIFVHLQAQRLQTDFFLTKWNKEVALRTTLPLSPLLGRPKTPPSQRALPKDKPYTKLPARTGAVETANLTFPPRTLNRPTGMQETLEETGQGTPHNTLEAPPKKHLALSPKWPPRKVVLKLTPKPPSPL